MTIEIIEAFRKKLDSMVEVEKINGEQILKVSQEMDELILQYLREQIRKMYNNFE